MSTGVTMYLSQLKPDIVCAQRGFERTEDSDIIRA